MRIFKPTYSKSLPAQAKILRRAAGRIAQFRNARGRLIEGKLTKDGNRVLIEVEDWHVAFEDHLRRRRMLKGYTDQAATQRLADFVQRLVNAKRTCAPLADDVGAWLGALDDATRGLLTSWGLLDAAGSELSRPLGELIAEYKTALETKGRNAKHVADIIQSVSEACEACGFTYWRDIDDLKVESYLRDLREGSRHLSNRRSNARLQACKAFCSWVVKRKWASESPLRSLDKLSVKDDVRHARRALSIEDLRLFVQKAASGPERYGMDGYERHLLYRFTVETGLRRGEIRRLRVSDFDFDSRTVAVQACRASKNRRLRLQALNPQLCSEMRDFLSNRLPGAKVFGGSYSTLTDKTSDMVREDLEAAGLQYETDRGIFDFHALRGETASLLLAGGVPVNDAKDVLRHSSITLTADVYAKALSSSQNARTISVLPDLSLPEYQRNAAVATGTDDRLLDACSADGPKRMTANGSAQDNAHSGSRPAFLDKGDLFGRTTEPKVRGSNPFRRIG